MTLEEQIFVDKGNLASHLDDCPKLMNTFEANLFWLSDKVAFKKQYTMKINTGEYTVKISKVMKVIDTDNLNTNVESLSL